ncbi:hypothetical protein P9112_010408 [Eukaryota sp. TZLM1-RC]
MSLNEPLQLQNPVYGKLPDRIADIDLSISVPHPDSRNEPKPGPSRVFRYVLLFLLLCSLVIGSYFLYHFVFTITITGTIVNISNGHIISSPHITATSDSTTVESTTSDDLFTLLLTRGQWNLTSTDSNLLAVPQPFSFDGDFDFLDQLSLINSPQLSQNGYRFVLQYHGNLDLSLELVTPEACVCSISNPFCSSRSTHVAHGGEVVGSQGPFEISLLNPHFNPIYSSYRVVVKAEGAESVDFWKNSRSVVYVFDRYDFIMAVRIKDLIDNQNDQSNHWSVLVLQSQGIEVFNSLTPMTSVNVIMIDEVSGDQVGDGTIQIFNNDFNEIFSFIDGFFALNLEFGTYYCEINAVGYAKSAFEISIAHSSSSMLTFDLSPEASLSGTVESIEEGEGISDIRLQVEINEVQKEIRTGELGKFSVSPLKIGDVVSIKPATNTRFVTPTTVTVSGNNQIDALLTTTISSHGDNFMILVNSSQNLGSEFFIDLFCPNDCRMSTISTQSCNSWNVFQTRLFPPYNRALNLQILNIDPTMMFTLVGRQVNNDWSSVSASVSIYLNSELLDNIELNSTNGGFWRIGHFFEKYSGSVDFKATNEVEFTLPIIFDFVDELTKFPVTNNISVVYLDEEFFTDGEILIQNMFVHSESELVVSHDLYEVNHATIDWANYDLDEVTTVSIELKPKNFISRKAVDAGSFGPINPTIIAEEFDGESSQLIKTIEIENVIDGVFHISPISSNTYWEVKGSLNGYYDGSIKIDSDFDSTERFNDSLFLIPRREGDDDYFVLLLFNEVGVSRQVPKFDLNLTTPFDCDVNFSNFECVVGDMSIQLNSSSLHSPSPLTMAITGLDVSESDHVYKLAVGRHPDYEFQDWHKAGLVASICYGWSCYNVYARYAEVYNDDTGYWHIGYFDEYGFTEDNRFDI